MKKLLEWMRGLLMLTCGMPMLLSAVMAADGWMTDLPAACRQAAKENKLVLIDFTGSDWCSACVRLRRTVLDSLAFREFASSRFVLMEVDLPRRKSFDQALLRRNEAIAEQYGVGGFPTLMVINPQGQVMGGFQDGNVTVAEAQKLLEGACEAAVLFCKAAGQVGEERARTLFQIYKKFPESKSFAVPREELMQAILEADAANVTGIRGMVAAKEQASLFQAQRETVPHASPQMGRLLEKQLAEALPANRTEVMMARCQHAMAIADSVEEIESTRRMFEELLPMLPAQEAAELQRFLDKYFRDPDALLQMLRSSRPR
ncbi:MAG: thioredoxin family protein [Akkermansia sp.]|nr:thioredoxin family protein [Akkermansia sp.]